MRIGGMAAGVGALALSIAAGGSGAGASSPLSVPPGAGAPVGPVGDAVPINPGVEVRPGEPGAYTSVAASTPVSVGDGVRTDATGFAEVAYGDGSRTRLDVNTDVEVVSLTDDAGDAVTGAQMGLGCRRGIAPTRRVRPAAGSWWRPRRQRRRGQARVPRVVSDL